MEWVKWGSSDAERFKSILRSTPVEKHFARDVPQWIQNRIRGRSLRHWIQNRIRGRSLQIKARLADSVAPYDNRLALEQEVQRQREQRASGETSPADRPPPDDDESSNDDY